MTKQRIKDLKKAMDYLDKVSEWATQAIADGETEREYFQTLQKVVQSSSDNKDLLESIVSEA